MNVVMHAGRRRAAFVEVQGTAEGMAFTRGELDSLLGAGRGRARARSSALQAEMVVGPPPPRPP